MDSEGENSLWDWPFCVCVCVFLNIAGDFDSKVLSVLYKTMGFWSSFLSGLISDWNSIKIKALLNNFKLIFIIII